MLARSTLQQRILCVMPCLSAAGILPLTIYRFIQAEWDMALLDLAIFILMCIIGYFAYHRKHVSTIRLLFCVLAVIGSLSTLYLKGESQLFWCYPTIAMLFYFLTVRVAAISSLLTLIGVAILAAPLLSNLLLANVLITLMITASCSLAFSYETSKQNEQLETLTKTDPLTKTLNRRAFTEVAERQISNFQRNPIATSMILLDIDHFKTINDQYGHNQGDDVLIKVCQLIQQELRNNDYLFRIGGEEFIILPYAINQDHAIQLAIKLKELIAEHNFIENHRVTISCGIAEYTNKEETLKEWYAEADSALYRAKSTRNTVCPTKGNCYSDSQSRATK
ncbi:GGDEF domain-containing protein [Colwellia sp. 1_MG-2023]|uniref:GGDEF domain-containing protein n=1 Tax=Colwellia sp. 1_MG-2023 TaxID=3062649 RepID=UPI0026E2B6A9|nr:GGDEF domain-containing protein [Colwellia sp. 1_MG-2023]MDO6446663.1 GGDEF domain-containing protein [Colwellia sp. 1_MG-2023]